MRITVSQLLISMSFLVLIIALFASERRSQEATRVSNLEYIGIQNITAILSTVRLAEACDFDDVRSLPELHKCDLVSSLLDLCCFEKEIDLAGKRKGTALELAKRVLTILNCESHHDYVVLASSLFDDQQNSCERSFGPENSDWITDSVIATFIVRSLEAD